MAAVDTVNSRARGKLVFGAGRGGGVLTFALLPWLLLLGLLPGVSYIVGTPGSNSSGL